LAGRYVTGDGRGNWAGAKLSVEDRVGESTEERGLAARYLLLAVSEALKRDHVRKAPQRTDLQSN
jgi:hypothetical protein